MNISYTPGTWLGLVRSATVIVLDGATEPEILVELWDFLGAKPQIHQVLNKVTTGFGTELTGMPSFGILTVGERPWAILRGDMSLTVRTGNTELQVSGREVTTWSERSLPSADLMTLRLGEVTEIEQQLPLTAGVVRLSLLQLAGTTAGPAFRPEPATAHGSAEVPDEAELKPGARISAASATLLAAPVAELDLSQTLMSPELSEMNESESSDSPVSEPAAAQHEDVIAAESFNVSDNTTSYDHLWDRTVARSVEDAAIRSEGETAEPESAQETPAQETGVQETPAQETKAVSLAQEFSQPLPIEEPPGPTAGAVAASQAPVASVPVGSGPAEAGSAAPSYPLSASSLGEALIDSLPWMKTSSQTASEASAQAGSVPAAAPSPSLHADHDGQTVMRKELELPQLPTRAPQGVTADQQLPGTGAMVLARLCGNGHANPPTYARCAHCGQLIVGDAFQVRRPVLGQMRISSGEVIDLDRSLIIGRQPSVSRVNGEGMPKLIQLRSQAGDISRSHVEVRLEGWDVVLVDLKATNGTILVREGQVPRRLGQGEQALLLNGDIAELGEDVSLRFEGLL